MLSCPQRANYLAIAMNIKALPVGKCFALLLIKALTAPNQQTKVKA
jgi:hypothetical protein